jgi:hypothetical protein
MAEADAQTGRVHRLRDLGRRGRLAAALIALGLVLLPAAAFLHFLPSWVPASDGAFIGLRAYDVGTSRTPLTGQPSFSRVYDGGGAAVDHPGPLHFYLLAPFVRALGASAGLILVSALTAGAAALISTWVVFRLLGRWAAVLAAVVLALVMFTTGAWTMTSPVSSVYAGYPVFCAAVLMWALLCGDDRLLPLAVVVSSLAMQTHLASGLITAVMVAAMVIGTAVGWRRSGVRRRPLERRRATRLLAGSVGLGLLLWAPVIVQQVFGRHPNLSALVDYSRDGDVENLGIARGVWHLVNALGWPPLLGRTDLAVSFNAVVTRPAPVTWVTAVATGVALAAAGLLWSRRPAWRGRPLVLLDDEAARRRRMLLVASVVLTVAGVVNGSRIPVGSEQDRTAFFHWVWPFRFFVVIGLALLVGDLAIGVARSVRRVSRQDLGPRVGVLGRWPAPGIVAAAVTVIVALAVTNVTIDRPANELVLLQTTVHGHAYEELADQVLAQRQRIRGPVHLVTADQVALGAHHSALALQLEERGMPVTHPHDRVTLVADSRLVDVEAVRSALVLVVKRQPDALAETEDTPGRLVAWVDLAPDFDRDTYAQLVGAFEGGPVIEWTDHHQAVVEDLVEGDPIDEDQLEAWVALEFEKWRSDVPAALLDPRSVDLLLANPPSDADLDLGALRRLRATLPDAGGFESAPYGLDVFLVTGGELDEMLGRDPAAAS